MCGLTAINDSFSGEPGFDVYSIPDALDPEAPQDGSVFLNGESRLFRSSPAWS